MGESSYALVDLMAQYQLSEQVAVQLNVNNVLDEKYRYSSYWWGAPYTYGEPRSALLKRATVSGGVPSASRR